MISVAHVTPYFAPAFGFGGPARSLLAICQAQRAAGLDVEVFTTTANVGPDLPAAPDGVEYEGVRVRYFPTGAGRRVFAGRGLRAQLHARSVRPDIIHVHGLFNATSWTGSGLARRQGTPLVISPQGMLTPAALNHHGTRKRVAWHVFDARSVSAASILHAATAGEAAQLAQFKDPSRIAVLPHPVPARPLAPDSQQRVHALLGSAAPPYVLFLGRVHPIKRLDLLATAFGLVADQRPDARLVIAGADGDGYRRALEPLFARIRGRVTWVPPVDGDDKTALLAHAALLVQCSDSESFGMSIAEALSAGVPVVATRTCPWPQLEAEDCGAWVEQDPQSLADAIVGFLHCPERRRRSGHRGAELVRRELAPAAIGARWHQLYEKVLD